jgi:hypothetical protein
MKREIQHFEFICSLDYLHKHKKEFHSGSIFIYSIRGIDCQNLIVKFFKLVPDWEPPGD